MDGGLVVASHALLKHLQRLGYGLSSVELNTTDRYLPQIETIAGAHAKKRDVVRNGDVCQLGGVRQCKHSAIMDGKNSRPLGKSAQPVAIKSKHFCQRPAPKHLLR